MVSDRIEVCTLDDLAFDDLLRQQSHRPASAASRRLRAGQGDELRLVGLFAPQMLLRLLSRPHSVNFNLFGIVRG